MTTTQKHPELDTSEDHFRTMYEGMREMMVSHIARMNLFAISGGRVIGIKHGIKLPVGHGYSVTVELDADDTYVVRRLFTRGTKVFLHGEAKGVYCERLSEVAYFASCFVSYDAQEWPTKA